MYKTILVPLDGSALAEAILPHVEELAALCGAAVILLQVIELPHMAVQLKGDIYDALPHVTPAGLENQAVEAQAYLARVVERLTARDVAAHGHLEYGPVVATILRMAAQEEADLIAMASHGRGGQGDVYYGSVAAGVLQRIDRPLLIVRAQA